VISCCRLPHRRAKRTPLPAGRVRARDHLLRGSRQVLSYLPKCARAVLRGSRRIWRSSRRGSRRRVAASRGAARRIQRRSRRVSQGASSQCGEEVPPSWPSRSPERIRNLRGLRQMLGLDRVERSTSAPRHSGRGSRVLPPDRAAAAELWHERDLAGTVNPPGDQDRNSRAAAPGCRSSWTTTRGALKSEVVMLGYPQPQGHDDRAFTDDGWLRTGDIGALDEDGT